MQFNRRAAEQLVDELARSGRLTDVLVLASDLQRVAELLDADPTDALLGRAHRAILAKLRGETQANDFWDDPEVAALLVRLRHAGA